MLQNQKLDLDLDLEVQKALGVRQTSMMYDCEVKVLMFIVFFFYFSALLETPIQFSAFSALEARYREGVRAQRVKLIINPTKEFRGLFVDFLLLYGARP